jgi:hypothetical protein
MTDPSWQDRYLKAAEEFFALARTTTTPFMRAYYERVAQQYLSSAGELRRPSDVASAVEFNRH